MLPSAAALGVGSREGARPTPPTGDSFSGPGALPGLGGGPGLGSLYISPPIRDPSLCPHPQDSRRWDLPPPISSLAEQGLYPPLPWQPGFSSGSPALCTWCRDDRQGRINLGRMGVTQQAAGLQEEALWTATDLATTQHLGTFSPQHPAQETCAGWTETPRHRRPMLVPSEPSQGHAGSSGAVLGAQPTEVTPPPPPCSAHLCEMTGFQLELGHPSLDNRWTFCSGW